jgi:hypothetical protein
VLRRNTRQISTYKLVRLCRCQLVDRNTIREIPCRVGLCKTQSAKTGLEYVRSNNAFEQVTLNVLRSYQPILCRWLRLDPCGEQDY